jgi:DNA-binding response OmpR family regulator
MKILILEDDELVADLLETVVSGIYPGARIQIAEQVSEALSDWRSQPADLVIADWNLPDGSGLGLVREIRKKDRETPVVIVTGRTDRDSILMAANLGISGYISKPFTVELVHERLSKLLEPRHSEEIETPTLEQRLATASETGVQLPGSMDSAGVLELFRRQDDLTPGQLAERWRAEASLCAKLLDVANRASLKRSGQPVQSVRDAIMTMGVPMALNQALALSMDMAGQLSDERLKELASHYQARAEKVALQAQDLAARSSGGGDLHYTAGLLGRVGELVLLRVLQQHLDAGESLTDEEIENALREWSNVLGNRVKIQWKLSLALRELVGAIYLLPGNEVSNDRLIMRAAALMAEGEGESAECRRLLRRLGFDDQQGSEHDSKE